MRTLFLGILILCLGCIQSVGATEIKGIVYDKDSVPVEFAIISVAGTHLDVSCNGGGAFSFDLAPGRYTLLCRYRGYQPVSKEITVTDTPLNIDFVLPTEVVADDKDLVVVKGKREDPAVYIMKQVIAHRKAHEKLIRTFEADVYLKGNMATKKIPKKIFGQDISKDMMHEMSVDSNGKGVIYLLEEKSHYTYQAPGKSYNYVNSVKEYGDANGVGFAQIPPVINIYNNNIDLLGSSSRGFISPANATAFLYYKFHYLGSVKVGDKDIFKIQVTPKRKYEPLFTGIVYVVDKDWMFQNVQLTVDKYAQVTMLDSLTLDQSYKDYGNGAWVIDQQILTPVMGLFGFDLKGKFLTSYNNVKVNEPVDPALFKKKIVASYDSLALDRPRDYWDKSRTIPMEKEEVYHEQFMEKKQVADSLEADSLKHHIHHHLSFGKLLWGENSIGKGASVISMRGALFGLHYNTVEGMNLTLSPTWYLKTSKGMWRTSLNGRYGFIDNRFKLLLHTKYKQENPKWTGRYWQVEGSAGQYVYQLNNLNPVSNFLNDITTLVWGSNYMKLYQAKQLNLSFKSDLANGFRYKAGILYENRTALENNALYSFRDNPDTRFTDNNPFPFENHKAAEAYFSVSWQPGWHYIQYPKYRKPISSSWPAITVDYTKGFKGIFGSKTDFDKWQVSVKQSFSMRLLGTMDYNIGGGGFLNRNYVGVPDMNHIFGNQTVIANPYLYSFQMAPYYQFSNVARTYAEGHAEWHLNGWLSNKIPVFRSLNWYFVAASNVLYINKDNYYYEISGGIENIGFKMFRLGRVDLVAGYSSLKNKPMVGVRISLAGMLYAILGIHSPDTF